MTIIVKCLRSMQSFVMEKQNTIELFELTTFLSSSNLTSNKGQYVEFSKTTMCPEEKCHIHIIGESWEVLNLLTIVSSVRSSNSHPDLLLVITTTHFFRSHQASTLDFHFLSHYSYIKQIGVLRDTARAPQPPTDPGH